MLTIHDRCPSCGPRFRCWVVLFTVFYRRPEYVHTPGAIMCRSLCKPL